jgi:hypothetical protein
MASRLVELYKEAPRIWCGVLVDTEGMYLECGRKQAMLFMTTPWPSRARIAEQGTAAFAPYIETMQVTIREVRLDPEHQKRGELTALVRHILRVEHVAVQLEAVLIKGLLARLAASSRWVRQSEPEFAHLQANYVRFVTAEDIDDTGVFSMF